MRRRVLLVAASAEARAPYDEAAAAIGLDLVDDPSAPAVDGVLAADEDSAPIAADAAARLGLPWHARAGVETAIDPLLARGRLMALGLPVPWFFTMSADATLASVADRVRFPCVVKSAAGRGAIRADDPAAFEAACERHGRTETGRSGHREHGHTPQTRGAADPGLIVEGYVPGGEIVLQGVLTRGALHVLAIVETWPGLRTPEDERRAAGLVAHASAALGLGHGPVHAVCRVNAGGVSMLMLAPWPMDARLARSLRFATVGGAADVRDGISLTEILLRHAIGEDLDCYGREM